MKTVKKKVWQLGGIPVWKVTGITLNGGSLVTIRDYIFSKMYPLTNTAANKIYTDLNDAD